MANNENLIPIPGRLHSVATEGHVSGADEIYDDTQQKDQATINSELIAAVGTGGSVDEKIAGAVNTEKNRAEEAEGALDGRVDTLEEAVGTGGSVDSRISTAVATETTRAQGAESTLQTNIDAEVTRAQAAEDDRYTKAETYNKNELNNMITTPNQEYVSVTATSQTTSVTDVLPATGAADTTYRVGNWDGTQYNDSVFSEYAWNGSAYIKLSTKSQVGEVYDISANHADTKYTDLAAALGTNGANIPQSLRKGGMSVKFVQSSDNKYVQCRCMANAFTTDVTQWQSVDEEPVQGSKNLIESGGVYPTKRIVDSLGVTINDVVPVFEGTSKLAIRTDGSINTGSTNYLRSNPIYMRKGDVINYSLFLNNTLSLIATTDINESSFTSVLNNTNTQTTQDVEWKAPYDCYIVLSERVQSPISVVTIIDNPLQTQLAEKVDYDNNDLTPTYGSDKWVKSENILKSYVDYVENMETKATVNSGYINSDGSNGNSSNHTLFFLDASLYKHIGIVAGFTDSSGLAIAFYDNDISVPSSLSSEHLISGIHNINNPSKLYYAEVPSTAKTIVMMSRTATYPTYTLLGRKNVINDLESLKTNINGINTEITAIKNNYVSNNDRQEIPLTKKEIARKNIDAVESGDSEFSFVPTSEIMKKAFEYNFVNGHKYIVKYDLGIGSETTARMAIQIRSDATDSNVGNLHTLLGWGDRNIGEAEYVCNVSNASYIKVYLQSYEGISLKLNVIDTSVEYVQLKEDVEHLKDNVDYADSIIGKRVSSLVFNGNNSTPVTFIVDVIAGEKYNVILSSVDWACTTLQESAGCFYINNYNGGTLGQIVWYSRPSNLPSNGIITIIPTENQIIIGIRGDAGVEFPFVVDHVGEGLNEIQDGITAFKGESTDIFASNGGEFVLESKFKSLIKRKGFSSTSFGNKICTLLYFSDLHDSLSSLRRIINFNERFSPTYIDDMLHGGDIVDDQFEDENPFAVVTGGNKVLTVIGNHDVWDRDNSVPGSINQQVPSIDVFDKFFVGPDAEHPYYQTWGVTLPANAAANGYCYWYKDYIDSKLRLIGLDCMNWDANQANWLTNILSDAATNGYHVVIVNHYCPHTSWVSKRDCTFCTIYENAPVGFLNGQAIAIVQNAIDNDNLSFVCWLFGHEHLDFFGSFESYPNQFGLAIEKANGGNWESDSVRLSKGKTRDGFDIISIDTTLGIMTVMRIGNNYDKFMRQKNYLTFDYVNHKIVGNS